MSVAIGTFASPADCFSDYAPVELPVRRRLQPSTTRGENITLRQPRMKLSRDEFERLAIEQLDSVDRIARTLTRNSAESEDLVQETYLRALRAADGFELQTFGIRPWLLRILHNIHVTRATRETRQPKAIASEHLQAIPEEVNDAPCSPAEFTGFDGDVGAAMKELPQELQTT